MNPSGTQALQRFIGFRKRKRFHLRAHWNFRRELHELRAVPARQVGHRTDRPFFPEKRIRKRWNITHMDAARDHSAAFANSLERLRYERADRRKNDRRVELHRRQFIGTAGPDRAEAQRKLLGFAVLFRNREAEALIGNSVFGIAAIQRVARKLGSVAEIFLTFTTK